jgi:hypothetical protein
MSLSASSAVFKPQSYIIINDFIYSLLDQCHDYYIKGGKAFNFYYPQEPVATTDFDIVATEEVCEFLVYHLYHTLINQMVLLPGEVVPIHAVSIYQTIQEYEDGTVRGVFLNDMPIVDVILVPSVKETEYVEDDTGIHYMEKSTFIADLKQTYADRVEKSKSKSKNYETRKKRRDKLKRTTQRINISEKYGGRRRKR